MALALRTAHYQQRYPEWPYGLRRSGPSDQLCGSPKPRCNLSWHALSSEQTKFCYVFSHLDQRYGYTTLRTELVSRLSPSREQRIRQFLTLKLGDRKPSQFRRQIRSIIPDDLLRSIWSSRLPSHIRAVFDGQPEDDFKTAVRCADDIIEAAPEPTIASAAPPPKNNDPPGICRRSSRQVKPFHAELDRVRSKSRAPCSSSRKRCAESRSPS
jgi:hypothetical protein